MPLIETFNLTPRHPLYYTGRNEIAYLTIFGVFLGRSDIYSFNHQHSNDRVLFNSSFAGDRRLDYGKWSNIRKVPHIELTYNLSGLGIRKELALVFNFSARTDSSLFIYTIGSSDPLAEETLAVGDNQFLIEVETLDELSLYFIHVKNDSTNYGGEWFFNSISGYVI